MPPPQAYSEFLALMQHITDQQLLHITQHRVQIGRVKFELGKLGPRKQVSSVVGSDSERHPGATTRLRPVAVCAKGLADDSAGPWAALPRP